MKFSNSLFLLVAFRPENHSEYSVNYSEDIKIHYNLNISQLEDTWLELRKVSHREDWSPSTTSKDNYQFDIFLNYEGFFFNLRAENANCPTFISESLDERWNDIMGTDDFRAIEEEFKQLEMRVDARFKDFEQNEETEKERQRQETLNKQREAAELKERIEFERLKNKYNI